MLVMPSYFVSRRMLRCRSRARKQLVGCELVGCGMGGMVERLLPD